MVESSIFLVEFQKAWLARTNLVRSAWPNHDVQDKCRNWIVHKHKVYFLAGLILPQRKGIYSFTLRRPVNKELSIHAPPADRFDIFLTRTRHFHSPWNWYLPPPPPSQEHHTTDMLQDKCGKPYNCRDCTTIFGKTWNWQAKHNFVLLH